MVCPSSPVKPVIKWAGGKRQLLPVLKPLLPTCFNNYYEPFFGGGALFCDVRPKSAVINDSNLQLVNMYKQIQNNSSSICSTLHDMQTKYNFRKNIEEKDKFYYRLRSEFNKHIINSIDTPRSAALLIFLNKAGFNGLYRVNSSGQYNVPPAHRKTVNVYDEENILKMAVLLKKTEILYGDFEKACQSVNKNDFVFFDSPYYDTFDTYQAGGFSNNDHIRLYNLFEKLSNKGVYCMLTNNNCHFIKKKYAKYNIRIVDVKRMINCDGSNRVGKEVVITNY